MPSRWDACAYWMRPWLIGVAVAMMVRVASGQEGGGLPPPAPPVGKAVGEDATKGAVADEETASGPIAVAETVPDQAIEERLSRLLPRLSGVRSVGVEVEDGVVTLTGHVDDVETRDRLREFALRVEGVSLVVNQTRTDAQVLTAWELLSQRLGRFGALMAQSWLAFLAAMVVLIASVTLARLFTSSSERLLSPLIDSMLLRSVVASVIALVMVMAGLYAALEIIGVARAVLSIVGLAGAVALALSFAFRDFAENFVASLLLGVRRPFRVGDFVEVAGQKGVVRALNTRATVLLTVEGYQVRVPNASVFKNVTINHSASDAVLNTFDVLIDPAASIVAAQRAVGSALTGHEGVLDSPEARVLVEALEPIGVRLRAYFWLPNRGVDGLKILSDARLRTKVALQEAGIAPPPTTIQIQLGERAIAALAGSSRDGDARTASMPTSTPTRAERAQKDRRLDARVAAAAGRSDGTGRDAIDHALQVAHDLDGEEGENLIARGK